eukprot:635026-Pleurochrysis_carterae.AAC.1
MAAKSHQRCQAASSFLRVAGAAPLSAAAASAALRRCRLAGATRSVMFECANSRAAFATAIWRA